MNKGLTGISLLAAVTLAAHLPRLFATDAPEQPPVGEQFKFTGGEKPLSGTALHQQWKLAWEDDFSKDREIDKTKWNFEIDGHGGGNGELEYYTDSPQNASIDNGELVITALKNDRGHRFTSARMTTSRKFSCLYGRIEASIKAPARRPAIGRPSG